jgi:hypothetical protein
VARMLVWRAPSAGQLGFLFLGLGEMLRNRRFATARYALCAARVATNLRLR